MLLKKIVVAEDDDAIAHMVNMALGDSGFLCLRAADGEEALNLVRMHAPDLLILDVMMPRVDGIEVARRLKADVIMSRIPILMLTALGSVDNKVDGFEAGADAYMVKPFDLREFSATVKALIRAARRERERNPTTNLPGSGAIEVHITGAWEVLAPEEFERGRGHVTVRIEVHITELLGKPGISVVHFDLSNFDSYADRVGIAKAETLVAVLGALVLERTRECSGGSAFVGHLGGVDFISVVASDRAEELAKSVISHFEQHRAEWCGPDDEGPTRVDMSIAVVSIDGLAAGTSAKVAERLASAMRAAKQQDGSSHVVWKPETA